MAILSVHGARIMLSIVNNRCLTLLTTHFITTHYSSFDAQTVAPSVGTSFQTVAPPIIEWEKSAVPNLVQEGDGAGRIWTKHNIKVTIIAHCSAMMPWVNGMIDKLGWKKRVYLNAILSAGIPMMQSKASSHYIRPLTLHGGWKDTIQWKKKMRGHHSIIAKCI